MFNGVHDATTAGATAGSGYGSATGGGASPSSHIPPNCLAIHIACLPNSRVRSSAPRVEFYLRLPDNHYHDNNNNHNRNTNDNTTPSPCPGPARCPSPGPGPEIAERRCVDLLRQQSGGLNFPGNENGWTRQALAQAQAQGLAQAQELKQALAQAPGSGLGSEVVPSQQQDQEQAQEQGLALAPVPSPAPAQTSGPHPEDFPALVQGTRIGQLFDIVARASELTLAHMFAFQSHRHHR